MRRLANSLKRTWPSALSGVLLLLAFPPFNLWPLLIVGLIPWLWDLRRLDGRAAWRSGYVLGFVYGLGQLFWVDQFVSRWVGGLLLGAVPWLLANVLYALYFGWAGVMIQRCFARGWIWAIPIVWAGIEAFRSYIPVFAFPWGLLATPLWKAPALIQLARFGTIYLVSGGILLANVLLLAPFEKRLRTKQTFALAATTIGGLILSVALYLTPIEGTSRRFSAIQPGVDVAFSRPETQELEVNQSIAQRMAEVSPKRPALIVLPEGMMDVPVLPPRPGFPILPGTNTLIGGRRTADDRNSYQSAFLYDGEKWQFEDKTRLVIFGEFVPGRTLFPFLAESFRLPSGDMIPGKDGVRSLDAGDLRVGPILCFEALFPDISYRHAMNGSRVLAVMSIDDWFMDSAAPEQLKAGSVWRAVETGLPVVRAASLGHTFATDARGRIVAEVPLQGSRELTVNLTVPSTTPTLPFLPLFALASTIFLFGLTLFPNLSGPRQG